MIARSWTIRIPHPVDALYYGAAWTLCAIAFRRAGWPMENVRFLAAPMAGNRRGRLLTPWGIRREWRLLKLYTEQTA